MKKPISKYLILFWNNLSLYEGFYWIKIEKMREIFKQFNGRDIAKQLKDGEVLYDRIKYPKELQEKVEVEIFKNDIENLKEVYYNKMDDHLRNIVDFHFKNFNFNNLIEFEDINFYIFIFTQFENFLFKIFKYVLMKRPDIIKNKSIELNQLDMIPDNLKKDFIYEIVIEKTLHDLFYDNYEGIFKYANNPLGLNIKIEKKDISILNGLKQIKNLYSHGDGIVNSLFLKKLHADKIKFIDLGLKTTPLGAKLQINLKLIKELEKLLLNVGSIIDKSLTSKYPEIIDAFFE